MTKDISIAILYFCLLSPCVLSATTNTASTLNNEKFTENSNSLIENEKTVDVRASAIAESIKKDPEAMEEFHQLVERVNRKYRNKYFNIDHPLKKEIQAQPEQPKMAEKDIENDDASVENSPSTIADLIKNDAEAMEEFRQLVEEVKHKHSESEVDLRRNKYSNVDDPLKKEIQAKPEQPEMAEKVSENDDASVESTASTIADLIKKDAEAMEKFSRLVKEVKYKRFESEVRRNNKYFNIDDPLTKEIKAQPEPSSIVAE